MLVQAAKRSPLLRILLARLHGHASRLVLATGVAGAAMVVASNPGIVQRLLKRPPDALSLVNTAISLWFIMRSGRSSSSSSSPAGGIPIPSRSSQLLLLLVALLLTQMAGESGVPKPSALLQAAAQIAPLPQLSELYAILHGVHHLNPAFSRWVRRTLNLAK